MRHLIDASLDPLLEACTLQRAAKETAGGDRLSEAEEVTLAEKAARKAERDELREIKRASKSAYRKGLGVVSS